MILQPGQTPWATERRNEPARRDAAERRRATGSTAYHAGLSAEGQVARHYTERGSAIVAQRWRGAAGEIDLIADDGKQLIFVEVKKSRNFGRALEGLTRRQIDRIQLAGEEYAGAHARGSLTEMRFDVALMNDAGQIRILENAYV
ncbi:YraN family protein [Aestuariicoccus sp. MJ-SS9]|uniref:YraN family protein n=1 Tax=Aestuariicoccus sp. MJ-SS9 TaxID=3079855 RepID=UPI00290CB603|nr:YraN family protein [Aestuariicoccus sp. MJ-SS9]MDU8912905.1 YraN family protein [Aestuariicoccus sp. MJ-SS9]